MCLHALFVSLNIQTPRQPPAAEMKLCLKNEINAAPLPLHISAASSDVNMQLQTLLLQFLVAADQHRVQMNGFSGFSGQMCGTLQSQLLSFN